MTREAHRDDRAGRRRGRDRGAGTAQRRRQDRGSCGWRRRSTTCRSRCGSPSTPPAARSIALLDVDPHRRTGQRRQPNDPRPHHSPASPRRSRTSRRSPRPRGWRAARAISTSTGDGPAGPCVRRRGRVRVPAPPSARSSAGARPANRASSRWPCWCATRTLGARAEAGDHARAERDWLAAFKARPPRACARRSPPTCPTGCGTGWAPRSATPTRRARRGLGSPAPLDLRVNPLKTSRDEALAALIAEGLPRPRHPTRRSACASPGGRRSRAIRGSSTGGSRSRTKAASSSRTWSRRAAARWSSTSAPARAARRSLLGALMRSQGRLYAFDVVDKRLANLKPRLARSGLSNVQPQQIAHERDTQGQAARGQGRSRAGRRAVHRLRHAAAQSGPQVAADRAGAGRADREAGAILAAAAKLVKPGGRLVYATCSVLPEENERSSTRSSPRIRISPGDAAPSSRGQASARHRAELRLAPHTHGCDGFFAAVVERD